jgi:hypothetical protein
LEVDVAKQSYNTGPFKTEQIRKLKYGFWLGLAGGFWLGLAGCYDRTGL